MFVMSHGMSVEIKFGEADKQLGKFYFTANGHTLFYDPEFDQLYHSLDCPCPLSENWWCDPVYDRILSIACSQWGSGYASLTLPEFLNLTLEERKL